MRPCDHRKASGFGGWFACSHPEVEDKHEGIMVSAEQCKNCTKIDEEALPIEIDMTEFAKVKPPDPEAKKRENPGFLKKMMTGTKALATFVYKRGETVSPGIYKSRLDICDNCPSDLRTGENTCGACGCNLLLKASMPDFECPEGHWGKFSEHTGTRKLRLMINGLCPGDVLMLTPAVRDLMTHYPNDFQIEVRTPAMELWQNNPYITTFEEDDDEVEEIECHYPQVHKSNDEPYHFVHGFSKFLESRLGVKIPLTQFKGEIYLGEDEKGWLNQVAQHEGHKGPFWIMMGGGKYDFTAKWWPQHYWQRVVNHFKGIITFVQCGENRGEKGEPGAHYHPKLEDTIDFVGKTDLRQFIRLMYWADGVITPVSFPMHLAAAVGTPPGKMQHRPCIVLAGGREASHWEAYTHHQFLHTCGMLHCCEHGGCWKSRCEPVGDGDKKDESSLCENPIDFEGTLYPKCMEMIRPEDVIRKIEMILEGRRV